MDNNIKQLLDFMENELDFNVGRVTDIHKNEQGNTILTIDDKYEFEVNRGLDDNTQDMKDIAYYISANIPKNYVIKSKEDVTKDTTTNNIIEEGNIYKFIPNIIVNDSDFQNENKLAVLAKMGLYCKVKEKLITSKDEDEEFVRVTFNIPENKDKNLPDYAKYEDFIVFASDLKSNVNNTKESLDYDTLDIEERPKAPYTIIDAYVNAEDGCIYLNCYDEEYDEYFEECVGQPENSVTVENISSIMKNESFEIKRAIYEKVVDLYNKSKKIKEDIDSGVYNNRQELITALESEREAVILYQNLIEHSIDTEEIELLSKILDDEKEHIALLSSLQAKQTAMFVADDNKDTLDSFAEDVIETETIEETNK